MQNNIIPTWIRTVKEKKQGDGLDNILGRSLGIRLSGRVSLKRGHRSLDLEGEKEPCKELGKKLPSRRVGKCKSPEEGVIKEMWSCAKPISLQGEGAQGCEVPSLLQGMSAGDSGPSPVPQAPHSWVQPQTCQGPSLLVRGTERQGTVLGSWRGAGGQAAGEEGEVR